MESGNQLFPIFLRLDHLHILVVGGGFVGLEKISAILKSSINARIILVAPEIKKEILELTMNNPDFKIIQRPYKEEDLEGMDIAIAATCIVDLNAKVQQDAKRRKVLVNVADTPHLCDFYMGSIVKKGELKIAISTNGKSPTFAKRIREMLEDILPESIGEVMENLNQIREKLKGDFEYKVNKLNEITSIMKEKNKENS